MPTDVISNNTTVQNGSYDTLYSGQRFAGMQQNNATTNFQDLRSRLSIDTGYQRRFLFDPSALSNISGPVTVSSASLFLYVYTQGSADDALISLHRLLVSWGTTTATWNTTDGSTSWNTGGAGGSGSDISASAVATVQTGTGGAPYWIELTGAGLAQVIEDWINGDDTQYGLRASSSISAHKEIVSGVSGYDGTRPELFVTWAAAGGSNHNSLLLTGVG